MLPMTYAPVRGETIERTLNLPIKPMPKFNHLWSDSLKVACSFWQRVIDDKNISENFKFIAQKNLSNILKAE